MPWARACVLASDMPEHCEVIEDTGFVFKRGDVPDLQRMLGLLLSDARPAKSPEEAPCSGSRSITCGGK